MPKFLTGAIRATHTGNTTMPKLNEAQKAERAAKAAATRAANKAAKADKAKAPLAAAAPRVAPANNPADLAPLASNVAPAIVPATATDAADENKPNVADMRERANRFFGDAEQAVRATLRKSVPIKPRAAFKSYKAKLGVLRADTPTSRQAAAVSVALIASGETFKAGATFPRNFKLSDGFLYCVENGCAADSTSTGLVTYNDKAETFTLTKAGAEQIPALLGTLSLNLAAY